MAPTARVKPSSARTTWKPRMSNSLAVCHLTTFPRAPGSPEMLDGRVKTLHPKVHGGILARRDLAAHREEVERRGIPYIDLVAVNLYDFYGAVSKPGATDEEIIENIDI